MPRALLAAATVAAVATTMTACHPVTQIIVVVDSDMDPSEPGIDLAQVGLAVSGPQTNPSIPPVTFDGNPPRRFPLTLGLVNEQGAAAAVTVTATASTRSGSTLVQQQASTEFVPGESRMLRLLLLASCMGVTCPSEQTCGANGCGPIFQMGSSLTPWTGAVPARPDPIPTEPIGGKTVWAAGWHSCANEGPVLYCWGQNRNGEIGDGTTQNASVRVPAPLMSLPGVVLPVRAVGLGQTNTCVCDGGGQAFCWGNDDSGQLGDGKIADSGGPVAVPGLGDCVQIGGGARHICAVRAAGTVSCWGDNASGQSGQPTSRRLVPAPTLVAGLTNVAEVFGGEDHTCARKTDKTVWCWGGNASRQLGDGTATSRAAPVQVMGLPEAVEEIAVGRFLNCARGTSGRLWCWGQNGSGQLGTGMVSTPSGRPLAVVGITEATHITAGKDFACALHGAGDAAVLSCWGNNSEGQLGSSPLAAAVPVPTNVPGLVGVTSIAAGSVHACARHAKGLSCWGENTVFQLGDNTASSRAQPVLVGGFP